MSLMDEDGTAPVRGMYFEFDTQNAYESFKDIVASLATRPVAFFRGMPVEGGFRAPLLFLLASQFVCGFLSTILRASLWPLVRVPVLGVLSVLITSLILYLIAGRLFHGRGSFEATFRVSAYSGAVFLLMWVSVLDILAFFYGLFLTVVGTQEVHRIDRAASAASVVMSVAASLIVLLVFGFWRWAAGLPF
jgi:hypothetical protein